jgi:hypothetical protein
LVQQRDLVTFGGEDLIEDTHRAPSVPGSPP